MPALETLTLIARFVLSDFASFPRELFHPALLSPGLSPGPEGGEVVMLQGVLLAGGGFAFTPDAPGAAHGFAERRSLYLLMDGRLLVARLAGRYEDVPERRYCNPTLTLRVDFEAAAELALPEVSRVLVAGLTRVGAPGGLVEAARALGGPFVALTRHTVEPKLSWLERQLDLAGILRRRHGATARAPILEVAEAQLTQARAILEPVDTVPATHPRFQQR